MKGRRNEGLLSTSRAQHTYLNGGDWVGVRRALHHPINQIRLLRQVLSPLDMSKQQVLKIIPHDVRGKTNVAPVLGAEVAGTTRITVDGEAERS